MVWEGWRREVSPYPDLRRILVVAGRPGEGPSVSRGRRDTPSSPSDLATFVIVVGATVEFTTCALAKRLRANWILELDERGIA